MKAIRRILPVILCTILTLTTIHGAAYMKIGDIKGEVIDKDHNEWINILSWSWELELPIDTGIKGGAVTGAASFSPIEITKELDKSSPLLMLSCATGEAIPEVEFKVLRSDGTEKRITYLHIRLRNVVISSFSTSGTADEQVPEETLSFNYGRIDFEYTPTQQDGTGGPAVTMNWDRLTNTGGGG